MGMLTDVDAPPYQNILQRILHPCSFGNLNKHTGLPRWNDFFGVWLPYLE